MTKRWLKSVWIVCAFAAALQGQSRETQTRETLLHAVPEATGWMEKDPAIVYDASKIESFDAKLAPLLKRYGVKGVDVQTWQSAQGRVRATLFEMMDAGAAYGLFTIRRQAENGTPSPVSIGAESFQAKNSLYVWQSN